MSALVETATNPFINPDALPANERNAFRWNVEMSGLDVGLILAVVNPEIYESKYAPEGPKALSKKALKEAFQQLLEFSEEFMKKLHESLSQVYDFHEELLDALEETLDQQIEQVENTNPQKAEDLRKAKEKVRVLKEDIAEQKEQLGQVAELPEEPKEERVKWYQRLGKRSVETTEKIENVVEEIKETQEQHIEPVVQQEENAEQTQHEQPFAPHEKRLNELVNKFDHSKNDMTADTQHVVEGGDDDSASSAGDDADAPEA